MKEKQIRGSLYTIREDGVVFSNNIRVIETWRETNTGYALFRCRYADGSVKCFRLHRILAEAFLPNPDNLPFVKHKNDDKENNSLSNLEWGSNPDNVKEGYDNHCYNFNARKHKVKVTYIPTGEVTYYPSLRNLSERTGFNRKNVAAVLKGRKRNTYKDYKFEYNLN